MKNKLYVILIIFLSYINLYPVKVYKDEIEDFKIIKVRDGDTFVVNIPNIPSVFGEEIEVRIRGIDTSEKRDDREEIKALAYKAQEELEKLLMSGKKVVLYDLGRDKYFRVLASVRVGDIDVAKYMIDKD
ncbi:nuclease (SNase domain protein) [Brachyspira pilosicoli WesB]|uniref:Nuclease (SNase domain protein) n=1 Tax=Brachyspira pilosicoli WesB TaxID=1161918 RepID=K0JG96_BRAPL|nr:thermonuclease family protein [Brachyspira pilosicoli]CCG55779.1 nuclease (SNase domain protein) [Brachyspira pilosicoli WesB]